MSSESPVTPTALQLQQQQLQYEKLTNELLAKQQISAISRRHKSKVRWYLFFVGVAFFVLSRYVLLKTVYKPIFDIFKTANKSSFQCVNTNEGSNPWNIVLNNAYPQFVHNNPIFQLFVPVSNPLSQDQAYFLWNAVRSNLIPNQQQIDCDQYTSGLDLVPLSFLCGDILTNWMTATGKNKNDAINAVIQDPTTTPWHFYLQKDSNILTMPDLLGQVGPGLLNAGFWGVALQMGTESAPHDMYDAIFNQTPPDSGGCNTTAQIAGVVSSTASFSMSGAMVGGPEGAMAGAVAGGVLGLGLGLFTPTSGCSGNPAGVNCTVM